MSHTTTIIDPITPAFDAATATAHIVTETATTSPSLRAASSTPAKKDRRKDHPAPLTDADRAAVAAMPYLPADAGDLDQIPPRYRVRALTFLREFADGAKIKTALDKAQLYAWEWYLARRISSTFSKAYEELATAHREYATAVMEDILTDLATGNFKPKEGCLPPETRAASVLLPAFDSKYRSSGGTAQQVKINISI